MSDKRPRSWVTLGGSRVDLPVLGQWDTLASAYSGREAVDIVTIVTKGVYSDLREIEVA